jgi:ABC-2 type transport system ATP-binding protein
MGTVVDLDGVAKSFDGHRAIDGLTLGVPQGSIFGLLGRNGAGKTTTIRMIMDIIRPDAGSIRVFGKPMDEPIKDRIGYLPEERGLYPKMRVLDMLQFQGTVKNLSPPDARSAAGRWLDRLELGDWKAKKVEELSKGMQQKAQFIAAVMAEPELLILDEPFSGMDPVNQDLLKDLILELNRKGCTIIFSTHVMDQAERLCREIALIDRGRAVLNGELGAIKQRFGSNAVEMEFSGDGSFLKELPFVDGVDEYGRYVEIRLRSDADPEEVLRASSGRLGIRRFEIMTPTLHNIFIRQVGGDAPDA